MLVDDDEEMIETTSSAAQERSTKRQTTSEKIYKLFKENYDSKVNTVVPEKDLELPTSNKRSTIKKMNAILTTIKGLGREQMYYYCELGGTFKLLKEEYEFSNKQFDAWLKKNNYYGYGKSMRNFYISLYDYALKYNKVMYVSISCITITKINKYWKYLKQYIDTDADFWRELL